MVGVARYAQPNCMPAATRMAIANSVANLGMARNNFAVTMPHLQQMILPRFQVGVRQGGPWNPTFADRTHKYGAFARLAKRVRNPWNPARYDGAKVISKTQGPLTSFGWCLSPLGRTLRGCFG